MSLLYLRLVGPVVLSVFNATELGRSVRAYAHCVRYSERYKQGGVVLYVLNLMKSKATISLSNKELSQSTRDVYWLEPGNENEGILSKYVMQDISDNLTVINEEKQTNMFIIFLF